MKAFRIGAPTTALQVRLGLGKGVARGSCKLAVYQRDQGLDSDALEGVFSKEKTPIKVRRRQTWRTIRSGGRRLESLHAKRQREGLTKVEREEARRLKVQYEQGLLIRARAATLFEGHGHVVSRLLTK